ncbi:hypothetical protein Prudu_015169 [Prunus dulcis]|uniref:Uncharacterized protein n=1 Tax=Prunus dulcis TaxID=3755 RepID=A0A4Y1RJQ7_PRUDU|nr:hypothetical protein Prudu_015169 [Prunus dulcis]
MSKTILLRPFKLVTVFLHEASHAIACKLTCGHVEGIQVHADEGGTTQTRGGVYWLILPAGYIYDDLISRRVHSSDAEKFAEDKAKNFQITKNNFDIVSLKY